MSAWEGSLAQQQAQAQIEQQRSVGQQIYPLVSPPEDNAAMLRMRLRARLQYVQSQIRNVEALKAEEAELMRMLAGRTDDL